MIRPIRAVAAITLLLISVMSMSVVFADGTETLGTPSIGIAAGSDIIMAGTGLYTQPGEIDISIPKNVSIAQVLLYWGDRTDLDDLEGAYIQDNTAVVNGMNVVGVQIGGPSAPLPPSNVASTAYRADITAMSAANGWISAGTNNTLTVGGIDFDGGLRQNLVDGAGILVIIDDGDGAIPMEIRDGSDYANSFLNMGDPVLAETVPQTFLFAPSLAARTATIKIFAGDVSAGRTTKIIVTSGGVSTSYSNPLDSTDGPQWDTLELDANIPAGATSLTLELISGPGGAAASVHWITGALTIDPVGVGRMTGGNNVKAGEVGLRGVTGGFTIHCDIVLSNNLQVNWGAKKDPQSFHLDKPIDTAVCIDDPAISPEPPVAPFDTFIGTAHGKYNGVDGATIEFTFIDQGERSDAPPDQIQILIKDKDGNTVLDLSLTDMTAGNIQAHYDQPHK